MGLNASVVGRVPSVNWTKAPRNEPSGAIRKTAFLFGSVVDRRDEHRRPAVEVALRIEREVVPVDQAGLVPSRVRGVAPGSIAPMTVFRSKKTLDLPVAGSTR